MCDLGAKRAWSIQLVWNGVCGWLGCVAGSVHFDTMVNTCMFISEEVRLCILILYVLVLCVFSVSILYPYSSILSG